jgi:hypothetical protein
MLAAGCGSGGQPKPKPVSGPAKEAADVIERLQKATADRDFATICNELLAAQARNQAGGSDCAAVLSARARDVHRPRIAIKGIEIQGQNAAVTVQTTATGQAPTTDVIHLVRERGRFRVLSLGR